MFPRRITRTQRPNQPIGIDWNHPISRGLVLSSYLSEGAGSTRDLVKRKLATIGAGTIWQNTKGGKGLYSDKTSSNKWFEWANADLPTIVEDLTIQITFSPNFDSTDGGSAFQYFCNATGSNADAFRLIWTTTPQYRFRFFTSGGGTNLDVTSNGFSAGDTVTVHFTYDGANMRVYENGLLLGIANRAGTFSNGASPWRFMQDFAGGESNAEALDGTTLVVNVWERALSARECLDMSNNSYQMLEPRTQLLPLTVTAVSGFQPAWARNSNQIIGMNQ